MHVGGSKGVCAQGKVPSVREHARDAEAYTRAPRKLTVVVRLSVHLHPHPGLLLHMDLGLAHLVVVGVGGLTQQLKGGQLASS